MTSGSINFNNFVLFLFLRHREHEKKMMEAAKAKERQMLARITDAEHRRMIEEEDRKRREEEELFEEQEKEVSYIFFLRFKFSDLVSSV